MDCFPGLRHGENEEWQSEHELLSIYVVCFM